MQAVYLDKKGGVMKRKDVVYCTRFEKEVDMDYCETLCWPDKMAAKSKIAKDAEHCRAVWASTEKERK